MKSSLYPILILTVAGFTASVAAAAPAKHPVARPGTEKKAPEIKIPKSVFILPTDPQQGRDPFFPDSTRPYENMRVKTHTITLTSLELKGISGTPGHRLAIINNKNFAVGDEHEMSTPGGKIRVRCVAITEHSVIIEAAGVQQELMLKNGP
jgi:hypothetical protein